MLKLFFRIVISFLAGKGEGMWCKCGKMVLDGSVGDIDLRAVNDRQKI